MSSPRPGKLEDLSLKPFLDSLDPENEDYMVVSQNIADLVLILPHREDEKYERQLLSDPGSDPAKPRAGSAAWHLQQCISDGFVFNEGPEDADVLHKAHAAPERGGSEELLRACYKEALAAKTMAELRDLVQELMLRYLMSSHCGFEARLFKAADGNDVVVMLSASEASLRAHADENDLRLALEPKHMLRMLRGDFREDELEPPYVNYDFEEDVAFISEFGFTPFRLYYGTCKHGSVFRGSDRIKIIESSIKKVFKLQALLHRGFVTDRYCIHSLEQRQHFVQEWVNVNLLFSMEMPLHRIADYLGEEVGFRAAFLQHLTQAILPLALVAPLSYVLDRAHGMCFFAAMLLLWSATMMEFWKRTENRLCYAWGQEDFEKKEVQRPQFFGVMQKSPVDRHTPIKVYPRHQWLFRNLVSQTCNWSFIAFDICLTVGILWYKSQHHNDPQTEKLFLIGNAVQIKLMNAIWDLLAYRLTDFENHETESQYGKAYVKRIFVFQFINSFALLVYIAYFKHFLEGGCKGYAHCTDELAQSLRIIYLSSAVVNIIFAVLPYFMFRFKHGQEERRLSRVDSYDELSQTSRRLEASDGEHKTFFEIQRELPDNDLRNVIDEQMEDVMGLGYVLFFGMVAPEVCILFFLSNLIRLRTNGFKWLFALRRIMPQGASGLGFMNSIYGFMMRCSIVSNIALLVIKTSDAGDDDLFLPLKRLIAKPGDDNAHDWKTMLTLILLLERLAHVAIQIIDDLVPDVPSDLEVHHARRDHTNDLFQNLLKHTTEGGEVERVCQALPPGKMQAQVHRGDHDDLQSWVTFPDLRALVSSGARHATAAPQLEVLHRAPDVLDVLHPGEELRQQSLRGLEAATLRMDSFMQSSRSARGAHELDV